MLLVKAQYLSIDLIIHFPQKKRYVYPKENKVWVGEKMDLMQSILTSIEWYRNTRTIAYDHQFINHPNYQMCTALKETH